MAYMPDAPSTLGAVGTGALYSTSDFSTWLRFNLGSDSALPTVTPNAGRAPDGTQTATRVVFNRGATTGGGKYSILRKNAIQSAPGVNTDSLYVKLYPGAASAKIDIRPFIVNTTETNKVVTVTDQWQRVDVQTPALGANGLQDFDVLLWDNPQLAQVANGGVTSTTADVLIWGFRVDGGPVAQGVDLSQQSSSDLSLPKLIGWGAALFALFGGR